MEQKKNRPLTHQEIKALPISRGTMSYVHEFPNNAARRRDARSKPGVYVDNNRKQTNGRRYQTAEVMLTEQRFGQKQLVPTGFIRKITHGIQYKLDRFYRFVQESIVERKDSTGSKKKNDD